MRTPDDQIMEDEIIDRLLRLREVAPVEPPCPELEIIARVQEGGADPALIQQAGEHLKNCEACTRAVRLLAEIDAAGKRPQARPVTLSPRLLWVTAVLLLCAAGIGVALWQAGRERPETGATFIVKGQADTMAVAVERKGKRFAARPGDRLQEGDRLGFFYSARTPGHLAFFDVQEPGRVTVLYPAGQRISGPIEAGERQRLPDGGIVRGDKGCEWLVAFFSDDPLPLRELAELLRRSAQEHEGCRLSLSHPHARTVWTLRIR